MAADLASLCNDLAAETSALLAVLESLHEADWDTQTPAEGWTIKDQIGHLTFFDGAVTTALADPDRFRAERDAALNRGGGFVDEITAQNRARSGEDNLRAFELAREQMVRAFLATDQSSRVPWYGPDMSVASALTARIMETWAHGQDVFDALSAEHPVTPALRQVAHIGVRALPNSFITKGRAVPSDPVRVELVAPDGDLWTWGPEQASNRVTGPAVDFCLVATQRRHRDDTAVVAAGEVASEWMEIAQAFAGPAGSGRQPGQFRV